jgi:hypothetical protein
MNDIDAPAQALAETYRIKLGLLPWNEWEVKRLEEIGKNQWLSVACIAHDKRRRRQCGNSTRGLLRALAEAVLTKRPLLVNGPSRPMIDAQYRHAEDLVQVLGLNVKVQKVTRPMTIFSDHTTFEL